MAVAFKFPVAVARREDRGGRRLDSDVLHCVASRIYGTTRDAT